MAGEPNDAELVAQVLESHPEAYTPFNGLVVIRDGVAAPMPTLCTLEALSTMSGAALSITRLAKTMEE